MQEIAPDPNAWETTVEYTPDRVGDSTRYVQRQFSDGTLSPLQTVPFKVGTRPLVTSDVYPSQDPSGGVGQAGLFRFSGGMPGIVSYDYRFLPENGDAEATGTAAVTADGSAQVSFAPAKTGFYELLVIGHTADGTATSQGGLYFVVAGS